MPEIGLTGGIGSGKSTVAEMFVDRGAVLIDADAISRQLMEPGQDVLKRVVETFGTQLLDDNGELVRQELAKIVFNDAEALEQLNAIVHPAVREESQRIRTAAREKDASSIILEDIPLLVETHQAGRFDGVIVVHADEEIRLQRLIEQRGMDESDARSRMRNQATDAERAEVARWIIDNSQSLGETEKQVDAVWHQLLGLG